MVPWRDYIPDGAAKTSAVSLPQVSRFVEISPRVPPIQALLRASRDAAQRRLTFPCDRLHVACTYRADQVESTMLKELAFASFVQPVGVDWCFTSSQPVRLYQGQPVGKMQ